MIATPLTNTAAGSRCSASPQCYPQASPNALAAQASLGATVDWGKTAWWAVFAGVGALIGYEHWRSGTATAVGTLIGVVVGAGALYVDSEVVPFLPFTHL